jgi:drug/metabolite transporter (DMT)-like permease
VADGASRTEPAAPEPSGAAASPPRRSLGVALAISGLLLLSLESPGFRLSGAGAWESCFGFGLFSALSMFTWVRLRTGLPLWEVARRNGPTIYLSGLLQAACTLLFIVALTLTSVAHTVVIFATTPAVAALAASWLIRERTSLRTWLGIAGCIGGIAIVFSGSLGGGGIAGDLCALGAVIAYAFNLVLWRRHPEYSREAIMGLSGVALALIAFPLCDPLELEARAWAYLAVLGLFTGPSARVLVATSTRHLPVSQVSLLSPIETLAAAALAWWLLGEAPLPTALMGGAIVIASLVFGLSD